MTIVVTVFHVTACLFLIGVVLLQQGKGADMGAVFGGSSSTIFGSGGAGNFLTRLTSAMAVIFMLTSLTLTYTGTQRVTATVFDDAPVAAPAAPAPEAAPEQKIDVAPAAEAAPEPAEEPKAEAPAADAPVAANDPEAQAEAN